MRWVRRLTSVLPLIAVEEKERVVPMVTVSVLVTESVGLAVSKLCDQKKMVSLGNRDDVPETPRSHPEMNGLATANTSEGVKGISNA